MKEYPKIQSIFKRDEKTHKFIEGQWSLPEFEYLANNLWEWTEKVDGTNIRVIWQPEKKEDTSTSVTYDIVEGVTFKGKTDSAQIPTFLIAKLKEMFPIEKFKLHFPDTSICLYGEGYGRKIQKGSNYIPTGVSFVLFDVWINGWWLMRPDVYEISKKLEIDIVPLITVTTIPEAIEYVRKGFNSQWGDFPAEGLVGKTLPELKNRKGERIVTKLKTKDFV